VKSGSIVMVATTPPLNRCWNVRFILLPALLEIEHTEEIEISPHAPYI
jgi:hypothetical protein